MNLKMDLFFLMSGVATDYTGIAILKDTTKSWKIALFLAPITVPKVIIIAALLKMSFKRWSRSDY